MIRLARTFWLNISITCLVVAQHHSTTYRGAIELSPLGTVFKRTGAWVSLLSAASADGDLEES